MLATHLKEHWDLKVHKELERIFLMNRAWFELKKIIVELKNAMCRLPNATTVLWTFLKIISLSLKLLHLILELSSTLGPGLHTWVFHCKSDQTAVAFGCTNVHLFSSHIVLGLPDHFILLLAPWFEISYFNKFHIFQIWRRKKWNPIELKLEKMVQLR